MSRAFVVEGDAWEYCAKAGERCMMAEPGKECNVSDCPHVSKIIPSAVKQGLGGRDKFVKVTRKK